MVELQVTVKLEPVEESVRPPVVSNSVPELLIMLMESTSVAHLVPSMGPVVPLIVAWQAEKVTGVKSAKGNTPLLEEGASTIHSAEDLWALLIVCIICPEDLPVVTSVRVSVNFPEA